MENFCCEDVFEILWMEFNLQKVLKLHGMMFNYILMKKFINSELIQSIN